MATWGYIISILYEQRDVKYFGLLPQIITEVEKEANKETGLEPKDEDDSIFFRLALEKSIFAEKNTELFKRVHRLLMKRDNIKFLNDKQNYLRYL